MFFEWMIGLTGLLLIVVQCILLALMIQDAGKKSRYHVYQFYSPQCWFALFFALFFLVPEVISLLPTHHVIGFEAESGSFRLRSAVVAQFHLVIYLGAILIGSRLTSHMLPSCVDTKPLKLRRKAMKSTDQLVLFTFFLCGLLATIYLGLKHMTSGGGVMRSELVKSTSGQILTAIAFFGNFAFAVLLARSLVRRRILIGLGLVLVFVPAVFITGSRGRFLWPVVLGLVYIFTYRNAFDFRKVAILAVLGLSVLLFSDTILLVFKNDRELSLAGVTDLFVRRNFDGFANFCLISTYDQIPRQPLVALFGARNVFMYHYFPQIFANGVGFGSTLPGMSWIAGGFGGLLVGGFIYGYTLGLINILLRKITDERLYWAYLFAMVWYCACGGNLHESLDKMVVAASPGVVWFLVNKYFHREQKSTKPDRPKVRRRRRPRRAPAAPKLEYKSLD